MEKNLKRKKVKKPEILASKQGIKQKDFFISRNNSLLFLKGEVPFKTTWPGFPRFPLLTKEEEYQLAVTYFENKRPRCGKAS